MRTAPRRARCTECVRPASGWEPGRIVYANGWLGVITRSTDVSHHGLPTTTILIEADFVAVDPLANGNLSRLYTPDEIRHATLADLQVVDRSQLDVLREHMDAGPSLDAILNGATT